MNKRNTIYRDSGRDCPAGCGSRPRYVKDVTTNPPTLRKVGQTDQQAFIQSFSDECDVNRIVQRFQAGDLGALSRVQGLYTDVSGYPSDAILLMNLGVQATQAWDNLTIEEQAKFGSKEAFIDAVLNPSAYNFDPDPAPDPALELMPTITKEVTE